MNSVGVVCCHPGSKPISLPVVTQFPVKVWLPFSLVPRAFPSPPCHLTHPSLSLCSPRLHSGKRGSAGSLSGRGALVSCPSLCEPPRLTVGTLSVSRRVLAVYPGTVFPKPHIDWTLQYSHV